MKFRWLIPAIFALSCTHLAKNDTAPGRYVSSYEDGPSVYPVIPADQILNFKTFRDYILNNPF